MSVGFSNAVPRVAENEAFSVADESSGKIFPLATPFAFGADPACVVLRNSGGKPLRLRADLLAEGSSRFPAAAEWHEIAIYRTDASAVAVAIRFLSTEVALHRAHLFETQDEAVGWLESFDPAFDLGADFDVSDTRVSVASVSLKAAALRDRAERLARGYRAMIGEMLYRLETET